MPRRSRPFAELGFRRPNPTRMSLGRAAEALQPTLVAMSLPKMDWAWARDFPPLFFLTFWFQVGALSPESLRKRSEVLLAEKAAKSADTGSSGASGKGKSETPRGSASGASAQTSLKGSSEVATPRK